MSIMVGVGRGAQAGVLIKNAEALERLEKVDTLVVDKTGTLTVGKPTVVALKPAAGISEETLLRLAASLERVQRASAGGGDRARRDGSRSHVGQCRGLRERPGQRGGRSHRGAQASPLAIAR